MSDVIGAMIAFAPILVILWLANVSERLRAEDEPSGAPALMAYGLLVMLYGLGVLVGLGLQLTGAIVAQQPGLLQGFSGGMDELGMLDSLPLLALGIWLPSLFGLALLLPLVRRALARLIPIDPESSVHAVALSLSMLIFINLMVTLGVGLDTLTGVLAEADEIDGGGGAATIAGLWAQQILMALSAVVGVGWLTRRSWAGVLRRLGVVMPNGRDWAVGIGVGLLLVPVVIGLEYVASLAGIEADADVAKLTEQLLGPLFRSPFGILTLGIAAALGEEPLFRGAAQPRFGLLATAALFALVHSNYGITLSTAVVFILGLALGAIRIRRNTSAAMLTHAVYNISLGLLAYYSISFLDS